jgi:hypothetical protein
VVAIATPVKARTDSSRLGSAWVLAAAGVLLVGVGVRLVLGGGVGDRSAAVLGVLLTLCAWAAAWVIAGPRIALVVTVAAVVMLDLAGLPAKDAPDYDDVQAFYTPDQVLSAQVPVEGSVGPGVPALTLLVQPVYQADQPRFGLAGDVNGTPLTWSCTFQHGLQQVVLPVPPALLTNASTLAVNLHLSGTPSPDGDYLLAYASSRLGGFVVGLQSGTSQPPGATACTLA